eukprot:TRINITY_DN13347_c0_g1_i1.p1 TRINITY_DN13347_c0_g1~~TRINITY_DN13347_c0_g1_i1.p1  ORF type:complete len:291 (-),score=70.56 TRINITY_DN13347_c0_g1_i1:129-977(-)
MYEAGKGRIYLHEMVDSTPLLDDISKIKQELNSSGFLLLRNFLDREMVLSARNEILQIFAGYIDTDKGPLMEGHAKYPEEGMGLMSYQYLAKYPTVKAVLENEGIYNFWERFFGKKAKTITFKWFRGMQRGGFTGVHHDRVYLGGGSSNLHTVWIPLGDIPKEQGTLMICKGSHNDPSFKDLQMKYGYQYNQLRNNGWFTDNPEELVKEYTGDPENIKWYSTDFRAGDVCILNLDVLHMSSTNTTDKYRISCDTRWQPTGERIDPILKSMRHSAFTTFNDSD